MLNISEAFNESIFYLNLIHTLMDIKSRGHRVLAQIDPIRWRGEVSVNGLDSLAFHLLGNADNGDRNQEFANML